jgi:hypothetical protein
MEMTFALAIQILLAQVGVTALQNYPEEAKLIVLAERRHTMSILQLHLRIDNRADLFRMEDVDGRSRFKAEAGQGSDRSVSRISPGF